jgi:hypothetical protein
MYPEKCRASGPSRPRSHVKGPRRWAVRTDTTQIARASRNANKLAMDMIAPNEGSSGVVGASRIASREAECLEPTGCAPLCLGHDAVDHPQLEPQLR